MKEKIKTTDDILKYIKQSLYLINSERVEDYNTTILINVTTEQPLNLNLQKISITKGKQNIEETQKEIIKQLNEQEEIKAYSFLPTGLGCYQTIKELINRLIRQSTIKEKKYIYVEINTVETIEKSIENLIKELKNTQLMILNQMTCYYWQQQEQQSTWKIRPPKENEYSKFIHMSKDYPTLYRKSRPDIFDIRVSYPKEEYNKLCNPHSLQILLVYEENNQLLGFIEGKIIYTDKLETLRGNRVMNIEKLFVVKEKRRQHIATKLYKEILAISQKEQCDRVTVTVYNFTSEAKKFFESQNLKVLSYQYEISVPKK